ncbi:MAG: hypothetical protein A2583_07575 [Bdellovibrionales bacterium RIFOXYD1_FULL_53_11]|nr:MAG: hypothetical protein A2583_07575 [Bdellovibrionales bacterium RIFOXYD1_FULL_53_11]
MSRPFDPNSASDPDSGIFGLPYSFEESALILLSVPWEATASYGKGTARGPEAILAASRQMDLYDPDLGNWYERGIYMLPAQERIVRLNGLAAADPSSGHVNALSSELNGIVNGECEGIYTKGKIAGVIGGEHSVPFGAIQAAARRHGTIGILHVDAHSDTRNKYEGYEWSHASIMRNVLDRIPGIGRIVQAGVRDFCEEEAGYCRFAGSRMVTFYDRMAADRIMRGDTWHSIATEIAGALPEKVWVSFDIDGLDPSCCPGTGTPVPGGMSFNQAMHLLRVVRTLGRKIIGFDLCEVAPSRQGSGEWDANVGARVLFALCGHALCS